MQKGVILGCGNRSNAGMDTVTLKEVVKKKAEVSPTTRLICDFKM
jgi:hypothetical protein